MQTPETPDAQPKQNASASEAAARTVTLCVWCPSKDARVNAILARYPGVAISHGICRSCMDKELAKIMDDSETTL